MKAETSFLCWQFCQEFGEKIKLVNLSLKKTHQCWQSTVCSDCLFPFPELCRLPKISITCLFVWCWQIKSINPGLYVVVSNCPFAEPRYRPHYTPRETIYEMMGWVASCNQDANRAPEHTVFSSVKPPQTVSHRLTVQAMSFKWIPPLLSTWCLDWMQMMERDTGFSGPKINDEISASSLGNWARYTSLSLQRISCQEKLLLTLS